MDSNGVQSTNDVLRRLHVSFRRCLNFQSISPHLRSHNLLTDHEWQVISDKGSCEDQVDQLLKYLPQKGRSCLQALVDCLQSSLDHAGHKDLLVELKKQPELRISVKVIVYVLVTCTHYKYMHIPHISNSINVEDHNLHQAACAAETFGQVSIFLLTKLMQ